MVLLDTVTSSAETALSDAIAAVATVESTSRKTCACATSRRACRACRRQLASTPEALAVPDYESLLTNVKSYVQRNRPLPPF